MGFLQEAPLRRSVAAAVVMIGCTLPLSAGARMLEWEALAVLVPGLGCGTAPTMLLGRIAAQHPVKRNRPNGRDAAAAPAAEPPPSLRHAYYICTARPLTALPVGEGWLAVGPARRG